MANLTHWNPFKSLSQFRPVADIDYLLRGFGSPALWSGVESSAPDIRLDISEDDKAYHVSAEIPGVEKKDIDVNVNGNQIAISAEVKRESKKKEGEKEVFNERYFGKVYRAFSLPSEVDSGKADARYDNGVLTVTLPKQTNGSSRKIAIG